MLGLNKLFCGRHGATFCFSANLGMCGHCKRRDHCSQPDNCLNYLPLRGLTCGKSGGGNGVCTVSSPLDKNGRCPAHPAKSGWEQMKSNVEPIELKDGMVFPGAYDPEQSRATFSMSAPDKQNINPHIGMYITLGIFAGLIALGITSVILIYIFL